MAAFLERFRSKPLDWADLPLKVGFVSGNFFLDRKIKIRSL
eukprot:COSAG04_NODE_17572_length_465_cov_1.489071_1_plen_40_part_01